MPPDPTDDDRRDESPADGDPDDERERSDGTEGPQRDDRTRHRESDGSSSGSLLSTLLNALESLERMSGTERRRGNGRRLDYDISIRSGLDALDAGSNRNRDAPRRSGSGSARPSGGSTGGRSNRRRRRRPNSSYKTEVRTDDERLLIVADVAGVDPDDVTVGYDDGDIVVGVEGRAIERVEVPWREPSAHARVKNGVLTVTIERGGEEDE